jgi:hypothetical protein
MRPSARPRLTAPFFLAALLGCSTGAPPVCSGDVVCPADTPLAGGSCLSGLECPFTVPGCVGFGTARCAEGAWTLEPPPAVGCSIGGFVPPAAETCRAPFTGTAEGGVSVALSELGFSWGAQGGAMIAVDVTLDGEAGELPCVGAAVRVEIDGRAEPEARSALRMRCGESHGLFVVLSENPCELRPYEVTVTATVEGVGTARASTTFAGGPPATPNLCP